MVWEKITKRRKGKNSNDQKKIFRQKRNTRLEIKERSPHD